MMEDEYDFFSDDNDDDDEDVIDSNPYLDDAEKGIELISLLLPKYQHYDLRQKKLRELDNLIDRRILKTVRGLEDVDVEDVADALQKVSDQLLEMELVSPLKNKTVVGVAGRFSAGKSCFINSCLQNGNNEILLPENQNPTTSIPAYIVAGEENQSEAYLRNGQRVKLNRESMQAMTHEFYQKYQIGFSRFVRSIVLTHKNFPEFISPKIALLDTPGYNKSAISIQNSASDEQIASKELRAADFLIWISHIDNGTIGQSDLEFIRSLHLKHKPLIVFNHADEKIEQRQAEVVAEGKKALQEAGIDFYDVIAYSAFYGEEYLGTDSVKKYFNEIGEFAAHREPVKALWRQLSQLMTSTFEQQIDMLSQERKQLSATIHDAEEIRYILSLLRIYKQKTQQFSQVKGSYREFFYLEDELREVVRGLNQE